TSLLALCAVACGSKVAGGSGRLVGGDDSDGGSQTGNDASTGFTSDDTDDSGVFLTTGDGSSGTGTMACAASSSKGQQQALDVYIMLDQSISMVGPKWTGVTAALNSFVMQPQTGVSVGIQYFALNLLSCTVSDYATPEVEIAPLPGVASKITASLAAHTPSTPTPTLPAEQGAIQHAQAWSKAHPGDAVIVVLATDGDPDACTSSANPVADVAAAAAAGVSGTPKILTFVIGVGTDTANLNQIAAGGGTGNAFIVDTNMNINQQFLDALNKIRGSALGCQYKIPAPTTGGTTDFAKVNVQFTTSSGTKQVFPQVADKAACPASGNAWYYDNPGAPTQIILCTNSCGSVSAGGEVDVLTGCQTIFK
ncbi:MAG TPA: vWA domain-containing protein, partial [Polyangiaceae bacterium]|nr:vWA domain-containing protein [Polyangiaceae bacterium]